MKQSQRTERERCAAIARRKWLAVNGSAEIAEIVKAIEGGEQ